MFQPLYQCVGFLQSNENTGNVERLNQKRVIQDGGLEIRRHNSELAETQFLTAILMLSGTSYVRLAK